MVVKLKNRLFEPGDGAQLGLYMAAVDRLLAHPDNKPTLGLLLVREEKSEWRVGGCDEREPLQRTTVMPEKF